MPSPHRREFLKGGLAAALCTGLSSSWEQPADASEGPRPNLIFLLTDDQRWDTLRATGNKTIKTPHLDRLVKQGTVFSNAFVTTAICCISRASILTGMTVERHRILTFNEALPAEKWDLSFPKRLREAGYRTGFVGKWGLGGDMPREDYDFFTGFEGQGTYFEDLPDGTRVHRTQVLSGQAREFLEGCNPGRPFCLQVSFKAPHCLDGDPRPFHPDPRFAEDYKDLEIPVPLTASQEEFDKLPAFLQNSEGRERWKIRFENPELFQSSVKDYYRLITGVDEALGQILSKLEEKGLEGNTVILFSSDNGFFLGEHGLAGKWLMHEESIRVPMVVYDPRLPPGQRGKTVSQMVLNTDIAPTLLEYAGVRVPTDMQGQSLKPWVEGESSHGRTSWFYSHPFMHPRIPRNEGVRTERWKYIRYIDVDPVYEELYDLATDPHEQHNLAEEKRFKNQLQEMRDRWEQLRKAAL